MATTKVQPIGITFPIRNGPMGYFEQSTDSFTAYRMNIINLLRTMPGERRMNPTFGSRLWTLTFESNDDFILKKVQNIITDDLFQWIPGVTVTNVNVSGDVNTNRDILTLHIIVTYTVTAINVSDSVSVTINVNKV
jgi:phage baseplate assembly protein W